MKMFTTMMSATAVLAASAGVAMAQDEDSQQIDDDWNTSYFYSTYDDDNGNANSDADGWDNESNDNYFYRDYTNDRQQNANSQRRSWNQNPQQAQNRRVALDREGAAVIGYDLDADGQSDVFYTVTRYEMEMIRRRAQQQNQGQQQMQRYPGDEEWASGRTAQRNWQNSQMKNRDRRAQQQQSDRPQMRRISGEIVETRPFKIASAPEKHLFARVETDNNDRMVLNLGPVSKARTLDLREGDTIQALVTKGTINDRVVPVAHKVRHQGQTITLNQPKIEDLKRLRGEVISTRTASLQNKDGSGQHMMVRLRTNNGQTKTVCLGSPQQFDRLEEGDQIAVLAAPGSVDGRKVYMAKRVNMDGQTRNVSWNKNRQQADQQNRSQQRRR